MKSWKIWALVGVLVAGLVVLPFAGLYLYGLFLPTEYETQVVGVIQAPPEALYASIAAPGDQGDWRPGVTDVEQGEAIEGDPVVVLHTGDNELTLRRTEADAPSHVTWEVVPSRKHVFQGQWTYDLEPAGGGTRLTVRESGRITSPFAMAATRALFGLDTYSRGSARSLARLHGAEIVLEEPAASME